MEKIFFQINLKELKINEVKLDPNSSYFEYAKPYTFDSIYKAKERLKTIINNKVQRIDDQLYKLQKERNELMDKLNCLIINL